MHEFVEKCDGDRGEDRTALWVRTGVPVWVLEFEYEFFADGGANLNDGRLERRRGSDDGYGAAVEQRWVTIG